MSATNTTTSLAKSGDDQPEEDSSTSIITTDDKIVDNLNDNCSQSSSSSSTSTATLKAQDEPFDDNQMAQMVENLEIKDNTTFEPETSRNLISSVIKNTTTKSSTNSDKNNPNRKDQTTKKTINAQNSDSNSNSTQESQIEESSGSSGAETSTTATTSSSGDSDTGRHQQLSKLSSTPSPPSNQEYHLKWIKWKGGQSNSSPATNVSSSGVIQQQQQQNKVPIVTQNSNGSCPLLAIINVLLLRKNITFPPIIEIVTASQLMDYLCDCLLNYVPKNLPEQVRLNYEQNLHDAMSIMSRLQTGLDVNVKFTGTMDFEYTPECIIFDLLRIPLYHGWLVDPSQTEISRIVNNQSYNQLVDRIIASKTSNLNDSEMFLAEEFLNQTASQLTNYGLSQLIKHIKDEELCILFRNNHFITLFKNKGKLYQLVTDQGFLTESNVVWESLNNIEGDTYFVDGDFALVPPKPHLALQPTLNINTQQQIDQDYLIALSLEQEQNYETESTNTIRTTTGTLIKQETPDSSLIMSDEELARKLQEEENQYYEQQLQQQKQQRQKEVPKINATVVRPMNTTKQTLTDSKREQIGNCITDSSSTTMSTQTTKWPSYAAAASAPKVSTVTSSAMHYPHSHHQPTSNRSVSLSTTTTTSQQSIVSSGHNRSSSHSSSHQHTMVASSTSESVVGSHHHSSSSSHGYGYHHHSTRSDPGPNSPVIGHGSGESVNDNESVSSSQQKKSKNNCTIS